MESPEEPEGGAGCKIRLGYLSVLGVGHGRGLLTDMYNAHLTKVPGLGPPAYPSTLSLGVTGRIPKRREFQEEYLGHQMAFWGRVGLC